MRIRVTGKILQKRGLYYYPVILESGKKAQIHHFRLDPSEYPARVIEQFGQIAPHVNSEPAYLGGDELYLGGEGRGWKLEPFPWNRNRDIPNGLWAYRGTAVMVEGGDQHSLDVPLKIKHAVLRDENAFKRMQREIEAFENIERSGVARRERIPDAVRLFVWQRDQGKCVRCGSDQKLEFDHIIPVVKGGSNTERNIQLLCESCNRAKGAAL